MTPSFVNIRSGARLVLADGHAADLTRDETLELAVAAVQACIDHDKHGSDTFGEYGARMQRLEKMLADFVSDEVRLHLEKRGGK